MITRHLLHLIQESTRAIVDRLHLSVGLRDGALKIVILRVRLLFHQGLDLDGRSFAAAL